MDCVAQTLEQNNSFSLQVFQGEVCERTSRGKRKETQTCAFYAYCVYRNNVKASVVQEEEKWVHNLKSSRRF